MKKLLLFFLLTNFFTANAQCPAPTYFTVVDYIDDSVILDWTENGTATAWEIGAVPNYQIGDQPPTVPLYVTAAKPFILLGLQSECIVFYVRSICINNGVSDWAMVASPECPAGIFDFVNSLSTNDFIEIPTQDLLLYPNPVKNTLSFKSDSKIEKLIISDLTGKVIKMQTTNNKQIDVEKLSKGIYIIEVISTQGKVKKKFLKE